MIELDEVATIAVEQMHIQRMDCGSMKKYLTLYFGIESEVAIEYLEGYELPERLVPREMPGRNTTDQPSAPLSMVDYDPEQQTIFG
jgi:hypothetical protein